MNHLVSTSAPASTLPEQSLSTILHVEIMNDLDDGRPTLVAATEGNLGDLQEVTPSQLLAKVAKLRADADRIEALANEYAATVVIPAFVEHYSIDLIETSLDGLAEISPAIAEGFRAFAARQSDSTFIVVVPEGQAPVVRLAAIRELVLDLDLQKRTAA
ncbi:hypothetical protein OG331_22920 [Streptomyces sp. NBC_01017]|uniref:hypothetical protein n=1 Tax=Streptomyces sp. NBC_01017 TaxID=2903721 RepID=UPI003866010A|nr:hypothetical protein OG331_22920 [Streptomyces sp. NBC_01017]